MAKVSPQELAQEEVFGEVIYSSNEVVTVQCYKDEFLRSSLKEPLTLGSIIKIASTYDNSYLSYGIVTKINNTSLDQVHKPSCLGLSHKEIFELQPQVYELLRKELEIYLFAYKDTDGLLIKHPPLKPMMIHDFAKIVKNEEIIELTYDISPIANTIKKHQLNPELLVNPIIRGFQLRNKDSIYLINTGKTLTSIFLAEMETLIQLLKRLSENSLLCQNQ